MFQQLSHEKSIPGKVYLSRCNIKIKRNAQELKCG